MWLLFEFYLSTDIDNIRSNVVGIRAEVDTFTIGIIFKDKSVSL